MQEPFHLSHVQKWRLILGECSAANNSPKEAWGSDWENIDSALGELYDSEQKNRTGGLGSSSPKVNKWLGDIRKYFPTSVVQVMQQDALERLGLKQMLLEPELLQSVEPDVQLVASLLSLGKAIPQKTKETARLVVRRVVEQLLRRLENRTRQAIRGALSKAVRNPRPRLREIDWASTIRRNLRHYQADLQTIIPEQLVGFGRRGQSLQEVVLCIDQSGSMASSVVYSSIFAAVMASIPALRTQMVVFDTAVVDLTEMLHDPVEVLFGTELGGGTDIDKALAYVEKIIANPTRTTLVLVSDLYEGGNSRSMLQRVQNLVTLGVQCIALLALDDHGASSYDRRHAQAFAAMGIPAFACTPDLFPDLMAAALMRRDLRQWMQQNDIVDK